MSLPATSVFVVYILFFVLMNQKLDSFSPMVLVSSNMPAHTVGVNVFSAINLQKKMVSSDSQATMAPPAANKTSMGATAANKASIGASAYNRTSVGPTASNKASVGPNASNKASIGPTAANKFSASKENTGCKDYKGKKIPMKVFGEAGFGLPREALPTKSGYLPISSTSKSKLYFAFYEATSPSKRLAETPWLLWLNGGPGCSSLIGCFYELGPWLILEDGSVQHNEGAWNRKCGIIFIDNPVGTGFSVAASDEDVPRDQETTAKYLDHALSHFVRRHPEFHSRPLLLAGESYAGKYIPALAHHILFQTSSLKPQLKGIAIGNGFTDPRIQVQAHADVLYGFGLLDQDQRSHVEQTALEVVDLVDRKDWQTAYDKRTALCKWIEQTSGIKTMLDMRRSSRYHHLQDGTEYLAKYLNSPDIRWQLNVDSNALPWVSCRKTVRAILSQDTMKSTKELVEAILNEGLPVLLYQGIYDVKDGPAGSENWMRTMKWSCNKEFWKSERKIWKENGTLVGYIRGMDNLMHVIFAGAGHQVPADQPIFSQSMFESWINLIIKPCQASKL